MVATVSKADVPKTNAKQWAKDIFDGWNNEAVHPVLGRIGLSHNSVNNTLNHGMPKFKLAVIPAIKDVLEKGVLIHQDEHTDKGNRFVDYFVSAPVRVDNSDDVVTVLIKEDTQNKQMYIHSVTTKERLMTPKTKTSSTAIHNILHKALTYKDNSNPNPTNIYSLAKLKKSLTHLSVNKANQTLTTWLIEAMDRFNPNLQVLMVETIPSDVPDNAIAWYEPASNQIHIIKARFDGLSADDKSMYVLHEMVHALTEHNLNNPKFAKVKEKLIAMHEQLYQAWLDGVHRGFHEEKLKLMLDSRDEQGNILYGEFIAYGLTDKDMQKFIADNLKTDSKTSVLDKFLNIAKQILGLNNKNFAEFVKVSSQLMGEYHPTTQQSLFGLSAMKSLQGNIKRGQKAMHQVLLTKADVKRAMYRNDIGWVDFVWGDTGILKPNGKTKGAMGISHILEARMRKDKMSYDEVVAMLTQDVVEVIAKGYVHKEFNSANGKSTTLKLRHQGYEVNLVKQVGSNGWVITAYELFKESDDESSVGGYTTTPTHTKPTITRQDVGASDKTTLSQQNFDDKSTRLYAKAVHTVNQTPTLILLKGLKPILVLAFAQRVIIINQ